MPEPRPSSGVLIALVVLLGVVPFTAPEALASVVEGQLPAPRYGGAAVAIGDHVYILGGYSTYDILRYTPSTGAIVSVGTTSAGTAGGAAAWGDDIYIAGGFTTDIVRFRTTDHTLTTVAQLPMVVRYPGVAMTGDGKLVVMGGWAGSSGTEATRAVFLYDVTTGAGATGTGMPVASAQFPIASDGSSIYYTGGTSMDPTVYRYDPFAGTHAAVGSMPYLIRSVAWMEHGMLYATGSSADVYRFSPVTGETVVVDALPSAREQAMAALVDQTAYVIGGGLGMTTFADIVSVELAAPSATPDEPGAFVASQAAGSDLVSLAWAKPTYSGVSPILAYKVYRDGALLASLGSASRGYTDAPQAHGLTVYEVRAVNDLGAGAPAIATVDVTLRPGAPTDVAAAGTAANTIHLQWSTPTPTGADGPLSYTILRFTNGNSTLTTLGPVSSTNYTDTNVHGTARYHVRATNSAGKAGALSEGATATPWDPAGPPQAVLAVTNGKEGELQIVWRAPTSTGGAARSIVGYEVYATNATTGGAQRVLGTTSGTSFVATRQPVDPQAIVVKAINDLGERGFASANASGRALHSQDDPGGYGDAGDAPSEATPLPFVNGARLDGTLVPATDTADHFRISVPSSSACFAARPANGRDVELRIYEPRTLTLHVFASQGLGRRESGCVTASDGLGPGEWIVGVATEPHDATHCLTHQIPPVMTTQTDCANDPKTCVRGQNCNFFAEVVIGTSVAQAPAKGMSSTVGYSMTVSTASPTPLGALATVGVPQALP